MLGRVVRRRATSVRLRELHPLSPAAPHGCDEAEQRHCRAPVQSERRPAGEEERELLDARRRSGRTGSSTSVMDLLIDACRVSEESWHGLGGADLRGVEAGAEARRGFDHVCGRLCVHGLARHEPDKARALFGSQPDFRLAARLSARTC